MTKTVFNTLAAARDHAITVSCTLRFEHGRGWIVIYRTHDTSKDANIMCMDMDMCEDALRIYLSQKATG